MDIQPNKFPPTKPSLLESVYTPLIFSLLIVFGIILGMGLSAVSSSKYKPLTGAQPTKMDDILNMVRYKYVDSVNVDSIYESNINSFLTSLDPHSVYIPAKKTAEDRESLEGNFEGIGIEFYIVQDTITVVSAISGGPSETIGLKAGDKIIKVNDTLVAGVKISNEGVAKKLKGKGGSKVKVSIARAGVGSLIDYQIVRGEIPIVSIDAAYMVNQTVGYIKVNRFSATTHKEFRTKLRALNALGMKSLILDLRQNPGGYLQSATEMLDELLSGEKLLVYTQGKAVEKQEYLARRPGEFEEGKLEILVDQGSASASEIMAGAVQDWDRGTIIGRTTFGKGLVQDQYELQDGSALRLTVARYYTPSGRCIQRPYSHGIESYYNEVYERYTKGEFIHQDSLKKDLKPYKTSKGRVVYAGGGIRPDIFVPLDTTEDIDYLFRMRGEIPTFIYHYYSQNPTLLEPYKTMEDFKQKFVISEALQNEFIQKIKTDSISFYPVRFKKIKPKVINFMKAYLAKQKWKNDGFYYILNEEDGVIKAAEKDINSKQK